jgi:hypothetical protein
VINHGQSGGRTMVKVGDRGCKERPRTTADVLASSGAPHKGPRCGAAAAVCHDAPGCPVARPVRAPSAHQANGVLGPHHPLNRPPVEGLQVLKGVARPQRGFRDVDAQRREQVAARGWGCAARGGSRRVGPCVRAGADARCQR